MSVKSTNTWILILAGVIYQLYDAGQLNSLSLDCPICKMIKA